MSTVEIEHSESNRTFGVELTSESRVVSDGEVDSPALHFDNFSLKEFFTQDQRLKSRIEQFNLLRDTAETLGMNLYRRVMCSALSNRVTSVDPLSKERRELINFGANNYLGLANHPKVLESVLPRVQEYGMSVSGSPILSGTTEVHIELNGVRPILQVCNH